MSYYKEHKKAEKLRKAQKRKSDKLSKKHNAIKAGKFSDRRLKRIIRKSKSLSYTCELACRYMKKEKNLFELLITSVNPEITKCICNNIGNLDKLQELRKNPPKQFSKAFIEQVDVRIEKLQINAIEKNQYSDNELMDFIVTSSNKSLVDKAMKFFQNQEYLSKWVLEYKTTKEFLEYSKEIDGENFKLVLGQVNSIDLFEMLFEEFYGEKRELVLNHLMDKGDAFEALLKFKGLNPGTIDTFLQRVLSKEKLYQLAKSATSLNVKDKAASKVASTLVDKYDEEIALDILMNHDGLKIEQIFMLFENYKESISIIDLAEDAVCDNVRLCAINILADDLLSKKTIRLSPVEILIKGGLLSSRQIAGLLELIKEKEELKRVFSYSVNKEVLLLVTNQLSDDFIDDIELRTDLVKYLNSGRLPINDKTTAIAIKAGKRVVDKYEDKSCDSCNGTGYTPYLDHDRCDWCNGRGYKSIFIGKKVID